MLSLPFAPFSRTRIAPTPSGYLHRGNLFSFLLTHQLAQKSKAELFLRIDDLDALRVEDDYIKSIFNILTAFSIKWQLGPKNFDEVQAYSQQNRVENYISLLNKLRELDLVYACSCSRADIVKRHGEHGYDGHCREKQIELDTANVSWRLKTDLTKPIISKDEFATLTTHHLPKSMFDFVVRRRDGIPAYQLTSLTDDLLYKIDFVVRGEDLFDSTLAQLYLAESLHEKAFASIRFMHHPLLLDDAGQKLSKTKGAEAVSSAMLQGKDATQIKRELIQQLPLKWQHYF